MMTQNRPRPRIVSWFSAGVSSAVSVKLQLPEVDDIIYIHIDDQHPDTLRFIKDCETWFSRPITVLQSPYKSVEVACRMSGGRGYINGPRGAACARFLKKRVRQIWESENPGPLAYIWGLDSDETDRAGRIIDSMEEVDHIFPLIDRGLSKSDAHKILRASGIPRPAMYDLGYNNNNCIGCVKGGRGYWNRIREDFPEVFQARAKMERVIKATCIKGIYLDELPANCGRMSLPIVEDCGVLCELLSEDGEV